jgi:hypothetical protein
MILSAMITIFCTVVLSNDPGSSTLAQEFCPNPKAGRFNELLVQLKETYKVEKEFKFMGRTRR